MSSKDFKRIAEYLRYNARNPAIQNNPELKRVFDVVLCDFMDAFKSLNGNFDRDTFLDSVYKVK